MPGRGLIRDGTKTRLRIVGTNRGGRGTGSSVQKDRGTGDWTPLSLAPGGPMSLKIHFCEADLGKITIADSPDPLWEVLLGLHALQTPNVDPTVRRWRTQVDRTGATRGLFGLAPARGYSPDFLTPDQGAAGLEPGLDAILGTSTWRLRTDLERLTGGCSVPDWARNLATGDRTALRELVDGLRTFYRSALAPYWEMMAEGVHDERRRRAVTMLDTGLAGLLPSLHPMLTWQDTTLTLHGRHVSGDLVLGGRGLRLIPSFFCHVAPTVLADATLPPVLVYPIAIDPGRCHLGSPRPNDPAAALAALLGRTRAKLLATATTGPTTTELAQRAGVSAAAASYHASILRDAGLIKTHRVGSSVSHILTELGANLLAQRHTK